MAKTFDIQFQLTSSSEQEASGQFVTWGSASTFGVRGFQFLINLWLKCLLTPRGSDPSDLNYGTDFTKLVGTLVPLEDARDVTLLAITQCNNQIAAFQRNDSTLTASELLASAQLTNFVEDTGSSRFDAYVELKNRANERFTLSVPVSTGD